jgi:hypothetical protein
LPDENKLIDLYNEFISNDRVSVTASGAQEFKDFILMQLNAGA